MLRIPLTPSDLKALHEEVQRLHGGYERNLLRAIFGDGYLLYLTNMIIGTEDCWIPEVLNPIEKLLIAVSSSAVEDHLAELCLNAESDAATVSKACFLLQSVATVHMWPRLPSFGQSERLDVQRCGVSILERVVSAGLQPSTEGARLTFGYFEDKDDDYIRRVLAEVKAELQP